MAADLMLINIHTVLLLHRLANSTFSVERVTIPIVKLKMDRFTALQLSHVCQVFMWLQEKSLFGEAALVFNPAPGLFFTAVDMIR